MILLEVIPEKQPALLSLIYVAGLALMVLLLGLSLLFGMRRGVPVWPVSRPPICRRR
jgi:cytochrome c biogenesis protein CcdA